jgi:ATP-dependent 26S proteasome regulatory subunit
LDDRPGRIDQAIEISLPDDEARRRLIGLYTNKPLPDDAADLIERLDGVAPAFIKELARRAQLVGLQGNDSSSSDLVVALDAMLEHATPVLRRTLAGPADPDGH